MKKLKIILFCAISLMLIGVFTMGAFAAVYLTIRVSGSINYTATDIVANIWGTSRFNRNGGTGTAKYLNFSGAGESQNNVYTASTEDPSYSNIVANLEQTRVSSSLDNLEIYVFIKNIGSRYIIPNVSIEISNNNLISCNAEVKCFQVSQGVDPLELKNQSATVGAFLTSVNQNVSSAIEWQDNSSLDNEDVYMLKVVFSVLETADITGETEITSSFNITIGFMADIQYSSNDILSVYQVQTNENTSPEWKKYGYNATLKAAATKIENNSLSNLYTYLDDADSYGNANVVRGRDDYQTTVVYKDIDLVNVDVDTGEIIGKLSDPTYNFEWYGRSVTLPSGTTLASGRTLNAQTIFNRVDVYTYFPTMYVRRWMIGNKQWISISNKEFQGSVKVDEYYTATFPTTIFNPDKNLATNFSGIIPRSYVYDYTPLANGSVSYLQTNYGFSNLDQNGNYVEATISPNQANYLTWCSNLTRGWRNSSLSSVYKKVSGVQGENWTRYVYNLLYLIKYADNNSQENVGYGITYSYAAYNTGTVTVTNVNGNQITVSGNDAYLRYETQKGCAIGVYNDSAKGSATYSNGVLSATGFNNAGMNYGFNSNYTYGTHKKGLYPNQFLTYSNGEDRYILDGYVGSDKYTSVFCLGLCNPWGNLWNWLMGMTAVSLDYSYFYAYVQFQNYNGLNIVTQNSSDHAETKALLEERGYVPLSFSLCTSTNFYKYMGVSNIFENPLLQLVGMPEKTNITASSTTGLTDYIYISTSDVMGFLVGGNSNSTASAGVFSFNVYNVVSSVHSTIGFRNALYI